MGVVWRNANTIGGLRPPVSTSAANGLWDLYHFSALKNLNIWPQQIVTSGLVLLFDPAVIESYSGSGSSILDISGTGSTGTLLNNPTYSSSNGGFFTLNGSNQYINSNHTTNLGQFLSFGIWCRPTAVGQANGSDVIVKNYASTAPFASWGVDFLSDRTFRFYVSDGSTFGFVLSAAQTLNNWYHVFATYNNRVLRGYINGQFVGTRTSANNILYNSLSASIGVNTTSPASNYFVGSVAQTQIYNRTLSDAEVLQNFNALRNRYGV